jgi:KTSC domain
MITPMAVKMTPVDAKLFESVGYANAKRQLYIKFRGASMMCFDDVPGFRFQGLLAAPRKDAYYGTYIKGQFLAQAVELPPAA